MFAFASQFRLVKTGLNWKLSMNEFLDRHHLSYLHSEYTVDLYSGGEERRSKQSWNNGLKTVVEQRKGGVIIFITVSPMYQNTDLMFLQNNLQ